ncbi:ammonium transporter AmtB-like domain-containing protein [Lipomyces japonicus]|uniref:ammonium transporter AmtB-like domain-containing protein n=1 Tax=Lipomyces japonicus TaxID=56871 RepID=UPI0034CF55C2
MAEYPADIFNSTSAGWTDAGGNSRIMDVNVSYADSLAHQVWVLVAATMIMPIIPGIGLFYAGEARRKSAMSLLWQSMAVLGLIPFQWFFWGYSLTYASDASPFIGTLKNFGLRNVIAAPNGYLPEIVFCFFQCMFCVETIMIMIGGAFERCRLLPSMVFSFCWATIVYCPVACWTWNANGWLYKLGALDFAGGGPVHIASGVGALAFALVLGKRVEHKKTGSWVKFHAHSPVMVYIGTILVWFGWFGFNGGSTLNVTVRAAYALVNTNIAASTGVLGFNLVEFIMYKGKFSVVGSCRGVMVGLVAITPAAGYVPVYFAAVIGFLTAIIVRLLDDYINKIVGIDEGLHVFKNHAIGGICGAIFTAFFAADWVSSLDGTTVASGWVDHHWIQLGYQLAEVCAIVGYTFVMSVFLLLVFDRIPGLKLRVEEQEERDGLDLHYLFEEGIGDYELFKALKNSRFLDQLLIKGTEIIEELESKSSVVNDKIE